VGAAFGHARVILFAALSVGAARCRRAALRGHFQALGSFTCAGQVPRAVPIHPHRRRARSSRPRGPRARGKASACPRTLGLVWWAWCHAKLRWFAAARVRRGRIRRSAQERLVARARSRVRLARCLRAFSGLFDPRYRLDTLERDHGRHTSSFSRLAAGKLRRLVSIADSVSRFRRGIAAARPINQCPPPATARAQSTDSRSTAGNYRAALSPGAVRHHPSRGLLLQLLRRRCRCEGCWRWLRPALHWRHSRGQ